MPPAVAGSIGGTGGLTLAGGSESLSGSSSYSGGTRLNAGSLTVANASALGTGSLAMADSTTLNFASSLTLANAISVAGDPTVNVNTGQTDTVSGVISDGATPGDIVKTGAGKLVLTAANTCTGATAISAGTLALTGAGGIAASSGLTDNGIFDISGTTAGASIASLSGNGTVTLGARSLTLTNTAGSFAGSISGTGGQAHRRGGDADRQQWLHRKHRHFRRHAGAFRRGQHRGLKWRDRQRRLRYLGDTSSASIANLSGSGTVRSEASA